MWASNFFLTSGLVRASSGIRKKFTITMESTHRLGAYLFPKRT
jgi:hypothetical protein